MQCALNTLYMYMYIKQNLQNLHVSAHAVTALILTCTKNSALCCAVFISLKYRYMYKYMDCHKLFKNAHIAYHIGLICGL